MSHRHEIEAGAAVLDKYYPQWLGMISVEDLDLKLAPVCIVGQLAREFSTNFFELVARLAELEGWSDSYDFQTEHGFDTHHGLDAEYEELTKEWVDYIAERRVPKGYLDWRAADPDW